MSQQPLEDRVSSLEQTVARLVASGIMKGSKDWRRTIGMFEDDPVIREIQEEGRKLREAERREAQEGNPL